MTGKQLSDLLNTMNQECNDESVEEAVIYIYNTLGQFVTVFDNKAECTIQADTHTFIIRKFSNVCDSVKYIDIDTIGSIELEIMKK